MVQRNVKTGASRRTWNPYLVLKCSCSRALWQAKSDQFESCETKMVTGQHANIWWISESLRVFMDERVCESTGNSAIFTHVASWQPCKVKSSHQKLTIPSPLQTKHCMAWVMVAGTGSSVPVQSIHFEYFWVIRIRFSCLLQSPCLAVCQFVRSFSAGFPPKLSICWSHLITTWNFFF